MRVAPSSQTVWHRNTSRSPVASPAPSRPASRSAAASTSGGMALATLLRLRPSLSKSVRTRPLAVSTPQCGSIRNRRIPSAQLPRDRAALVGDEPARAVGRGERVVGAREDRLVERRSQSAFEPLQPSAGVAAAAARPGLAAGDHDHHHQQRGHHHGGGHPGADQGAAARRPRPRPRSGRAAGAARAARSRRRRRGRRRRRWRRPAAPASARARPPTPSASAATPRSTRARDGARALQQPPPQLLGGRLHVARVERGGRAGEDHAEQREQQAPRDQVAQVGVEQPRRRRRGPPGRSPRPCPITPASTRATQDQQRDREQRAGRRDADARAQHGQRRSGADRHRCGEQRSPPAAAAAIRTGAACRRPPASGRRSRRG